MYALLENYVASLGVSANYLLKPKLAVVETKIPCINILSLQNLFLIVWTVKNLVNHGSEFYTINSVYIWIV